MSWSKRLQSELFRIFRRYPAYVALIFSGFAVALILIGLILSENNAALPNNTATHTLKVHSVPSPSFSKRQKHATIRAIVIQVYRQEDFKTQLRKIKRAPFRYSTHFSITSDGVIFSHVPVEKRAWHTPYGQFPDGRRHVNDYSIGIGIFPGTFGLKKYPAKQLESLHSLIEQLVAEHPIHLIVTESQVSGTPRSDFKDYDFPFAALKDFQEYFIPAVRKNSE